MPLAKVFSAALSGLDGVQVEVEANITRGLPQFTIVGLPDKAVQESRKRIQAAIENTGYDFPRGNVTVNLAPADLKKVGPGYDLPIALAVLIASGLPLKREIADAVFYSELSLDGRLRPVSGVLPLVVGLKSKRKFFVAHENVDEARWVGGVEVFGCRHVSELVEYLLGSRELTAASRLELGRRRQYEFDFAYIAGQEQAKRGLEIAAAGGHNVLLWGPPGSGKTLLARSFPSVLPAMSEEEILEVSKIYSIAGLLNNNHPVVSERPFRAPHHTASAISLIGGGSSPKPGEISLAHRGALFMDELPEFPRSVLESLRQPLEDGEVTVSRVVGSYTYPARFIFIAAQNPCPCGYLTDPAKRCICSTTQILNYHKKVSGPLLDRIDMHIEAPKVTYDKLSREEVAEGSSSIRERVEQARSRQMRRQNKTNAELSIRQLKQYCVLNGPVKRQLEQAMETLSISARGFHRIIKVSRTIADLAGETDITEPAILEALQYRPKERPI